MSKEQRWENAQNGEEKYFNTVYKKNSLYLLDMKRVRALAKFIIDTIETINNNRLISPKLLEVGSGPIGLIWGFPFPDLYGVDPLDDKYKNEPKQKTFLLLTNTLIA